MDSAAPKGSFGRHRKIMPFEPGSIEALREDSRQKAASLNQHVLGYGAIAEGEWAAAGIAAPDLPAMRKYRLERIRAELKRRGYAGALLYDPVNIRYATDFDQHAALGRAQPDAPLLRRHRRPGGAVRLFLLRAPVRPFRRRRRGAAGRVVDVSLQRRTDGTESAPLGRRHRRSGQGAWRRQQPHRRRPHQSGRRRGTRPPWHLPSAMAKR